jgi:PAS domain S-box-containing protein
MSAPDREGPSPAPVEASALVSIFSALSGNAALLSLDSHILAITDDYCRAAHMRPEAMLGRSAFEVFPDPLGASSADGVSNMLASLNRVIALKQRDELPFQRYDIVQPDGTFEERYWRAWNQPILGPDGEVRFILHQAEELSAAARLESLGPQRPVAPAGHSEEEAARFALAAKATDDAIWDWHMRSGELIWQEGICRSFGYRWDEVAMTSRWREERVHPDDREAVMAGMRAACHPSGESVWRGDYRFLRADGTYAWVSDRAYCVRNAAGEPVRMVGAMRDTTVFKQAEELLRVTNRQLEHHQAEIAEEMAHKADELRKGIEHRARLVVERQAARSEAQDRARERDRLWERSVDLIAVIDEQGRFERVSPSWEPTLGWTSRELGHRPFIDFVHPDDVADTLAQEALTRQGAPAMAFENRFRCQDGTYRWVSWSVSQENGKLYCVARDVTAIKAQDAALRNQTAALARANAYKDRFFELLSQELRTPLHAIVGFGSILDDELEGGLNDKQHAAVTQVLRAAEGMGAIVDALLPRPSDELGRPALSGLPVVFCEALDEAIRRARPLAAEKGLTLSAAPCDAGLVVVADPRHLVYVLTVLLTNAIAVTPRGSVEVHVEADGDALRCDVTDTGVGPAAAEQPHLFESLTPDEAGGAGLKLSIAKKLVETYGGAFGVRTDSGVGSTSWIRLPLGPAAE